MWSISSNIGARVYWGACLARGVRLLARGRARAVARAVPLEAPRGPAFHSGRRRGHLELCAVARGLLRLDRGRRWTSALAPHDLFDLLAVERLVRKQCGGQLVQRLAVLGDQAPRLELRFVDQPLLLLVPLCASRFRKERARGGVLPRDQPATHAVFLDHRAADLDRPAKIIGRARRDAPENDLLRDPAPEENLQVIEQLFLRLQVSVLVRKVERV